MFAEIWNDKNYFNEFVKPPSIDNLFYGDIKGNTCLAGESTDQP